MRMLPTAMLALFLFTACGDDDDAPAKTAANGGSGSPAGGNGSSAGGGKSAAGGSGGSSSSDAACDVTIKLLDYKLDPADVKLDSGPVVLCAVNNGKAPHDLAVRDSSKKVLGKTATLGPNDTGRFSLDIDAATYDIFCTQAGHESLGMKGTLTIK